jgi:hypothetical protein
MVFAVNPTADDTYDAFKVCLILLTSHCFSVTDVSSPQAKATGSNSSSPSSVGSSSSGSVPSPSASYNSPSTNAALGLDLSELTGIISLVAILAGTVL